MVVTFVANLLLLQIFTAKPAAMAAPDDGLPVAASCSDAGRVQERCSSPVVQATADEGLEQAKAAVVLNFRDRRIDRKNVKCRKKILIDRRTRCQLSLPADHPKYR